MSCDVNIAMILNDKVRGFVILEFANSDKSWSQQQP
jgi:hypothetical protein